MTEEVASVDDRLCTHRDAVEGLCPACGHCNHEVLLNGTCFVCGAAPQPSTLIEPGALLRNKR